MRDTILDQQKAFLLIVQFNDGAKRDTCAAISPKNLANYIELALGETLGAAPAAAAPATPISTGVASRATAGVGELSDEDVKAALQGKGSNDWVAILDAELGAYSGAQVPEMVLVPSSGHLGHAKHLGTKAISVLHSISGRSRERADSLRSGFMSRRTYSTDANRSRVLCSCLIQRVALSKKPITLNPFLTHGGTYSALRTIAKRCVRGLR